MDKATMNQLRKNLEFARAIQEKYPDKYSEYIAVLCLKCKWHAGAFQDLTQCQFCLSPITSTRMPCPYYITTNG